MYYGTVWYPEHWDESRWPTDLAMMRDLGFNVVRTTEYNWTLLEPREGEYHLDGLHRAVDAAAKFGIEVVLTVPSDSPPAWMADKYPDIIRIEEDGRPVLARTRRHYNPASPRYRDFCATIAEKLAERFADHPNVIGWQICNEYCWKSYDEHTKARFHDWLKQRYGSLDELNRRWTTMAWNQVYTDWSHIPFPIGWPNPCLDIEFYRFASLMFREFQKVQIDALRKHIPREHWITHNMHCFDELDFTQIMRDADVAAWDPYPCRYREDSLVDPHYMGWVSDFARNFKSRKHWITETQPGHTNWGYPNVEMPRGAVRAMCWHFYAHGAESVMYWQWRSPYAGHEQYHGVIVAPDGNLRPLGKEVGEVGAEFKRLAPVLKDAHPHAETALIYSYVDQTSLRHQPHNKRFDRDKHMTHWYGSLRRLPVEVDLIEPGADFTKYKLVTAPHLHCLDDAVAQRLADYVQQGGHLMLGPRSGFKDEINALKPERQPGVILGKLLGAAVADYYAMGKAAPVSGEIGKGEVDIWAEYLDVSADDAQVLLTYGKDNGWIDDQPAMVTRAVGKGRISYLGAYLDAPLMDKAMRWIAESAGVANDFDALPLMVEMCRLRRDGGDVCFVINHGTDDVTYKLPRAMKQLLPSETDSVSTLKLPPFEVVVLIDENA